MSARNVRLDHLLGVYRVGSGDWEWREEYDNLINQPDTQKLLARIRAEGIREPILLGTDGRIWDGHHRIIIAMHLGLDSVPVEFAGEGGALNALIAEKRAEWEAEQGTRRVFAAAYRAPNGRVISIGGETVVQEHAQKTVDEFAREDDEGPAYFLASRIVPPWVPVNENGSAER